jgi:hypothetical protein
MRSAMRSATEKHEIAVVLALGMFHVIQVR